MYIFFEQVRMTSNIKHLPKILQFEWKGRQNFIPNFDLSLSSFRVKKIVLEMTRDKCHVTCDTWHMTGGGRWTFSKNFSFLALAVWEWRFDKNTFTTLKKIYQLINQLITPGLLNAMYLKLSLLVKQFMNILCDQKSPFIYIKKLQRVDKQTEWCTNISFYRLNGGYINKVFNLTL